MPPRRKPPPPTLVLFVRHGLTPTTGKVLPGQARGLHLADAGRAQAHRTGERIAVVPRVGAVYSSPLERARETAAAIARPHKLRVRTDRRLLDADAGEWTGRQLKELARMPECCDPYIYFHRVRPYIHGTNRDPVGLGAPLRGRDARSMSLIR